jgi:hypothetical protein
MTDTRLDELATRYKKGIASRYRAIEPGEISTIPRGRCFASPKIDGELWFAELEDGRATLFTRNGRRIADSPAVTALTAAAARAKARIVIAGELHARDGSPRPRVGDVATALADGKHERLAFRAFDVVELDDGSPPVAYEDRLAALRDVFAGAVDDAAGVMPTEDMADPTALSEFVTEWVTSGKAEGLVVRSSSGEIFKVKPSFTLDTVVCGFTTRANEPDQARSLLMGLVRPAGGVLLVGSGGNMPGEQVRREVLKTLLDHECESRFRHASPDGSIYRFVRPEVVVEVTCSDLQFEDSSGDFIRKWVIRHEEETWHPVIDANSVSLIHPIISRIRTDKLADGLDARVSQLEERVIAAAFAERVAPRLLPRSTMVRREVWTKASKTGTAVRKLLVWRTGKEAQWPGWPAWVVHFTDYSPDRKTPLERAFRTALTEEDAMAAAAEMVTENIKKGWEPAAQMTAVAKFSKASQPASPPVEPATEPVAAADVPPAKVKAKKSAKKTATKKTVKKTAKKVATKKARKAK